MRIKELSKKYLGQSCIVKQQYKGSEGIGYEEYYITDISKSDYDCIDFGWQIDGNVFGLEITPWFNKKRPFYEINISTNAFWSDKSNSDCKLEDADFEFGTKEYVMSKLHKRVDELMNINEP